MDRQSLWQSPVRQEPTALRRLCRSMEILLKFLPSTGQPLVVRYGLTTTLVAVFFLFSVAADTNHTIRPPRIISPCPNAGTRQTDRDDDA
jgi:hypothetical protein